MADYYNRQGQPIGRMDWAKNSDDKKVAYDEVTVDSKTYRVSTVWLGLNHQFGDGPPLIFETKVFPEDSYMDLECERYSTEEDALVGHRTMVEYIQTEYPPSENSDGQ